MVENNPTEIATSGPLSVVPAQQPSMIGDVQTEATTSFLKRLATEDQFNAYCIDC